MKTPLVLTVTAIIAFTFPLTIAAAQRHHQHHKSKYAQGRVYVSQFGAKPDDNIDDSQGIAAAIAYATKNKISTVYFGPGTYIVAHPVNVTTSIAGDGKVVLKLADNTNSFMFNIDGDNINIHNLTFDGNRANQATPGFTENYAGFDKDNLLQSFHFFKKLHISNCNFYNCKMGSMAFLPGNSAAVLEAYPNNKTNYPGTDRAIDSLVIESCNFANQGTQGIVVFLDYSFLKIQNGKLIFPGTISLLNCNFKNIGTFTPNQPVLNRFRQGDTFVCGGVSNLFINNCKFDNSQRFDIKLGAVNNVVVTNNSSHNPRWGFFQVQNAKISNQTQPSGIGNITISNNKFLFDLPVDSIQQKESNIGLFIQLKGSIAKDGPQDYYNRVNINHNSIVYEGDNPKTWDCIQINEYAKYSNVIISDNYVQNNRRGFVSFAKPVVDNWQMDSLIVKDNVALNEHALVTYNSFFYAQGTSNNKINNLIFQNNIALGYNIPIACDADVCNNLFLFNNKFVAHSGDAILFTKPGTTFRTVQISGNYFKGDIHDAGTSGSNVINATGNTFARPENLNGSSPNYVKGNNKVSDFKVNLTEVQRHKIVGDNMSNGIITPHINKFVENGTIVNQ